MTRAVVPQIELKVMFRDRIYESFLKDCRAYRLEGEWSSLKGKVDLWRAPRHPEATLDTLLDNFVEADLLDSNLVVAGDDGFRLNSLLTKPSTIIFPCREPQSLSAYDLMTERGTLSGELPVCAVLRDAFTRKSMAMFGLICIGSNMKDLAPLRRMGFATTVAHGLDQITGKDLTQFCRAFGFPRADAQCSRIDDGRMWPSRSNAEPFARGNEGVDGDVKGRRTSSADGNAHQQSDARRTRPVLLAWMPSELRPRASKRLDRVISHLTNIEKNLQISLDDVLVWRASEEDLERFRFCLEHASREHVRAALLKSMEGMIPATEPPEDCSSVSSLVEAHRRLDEMASDPLVDGQWRKELWADYERALDNDLVEPLLREAARHTEPEERVRLSTLANLTRVLGPEAIRISQKLGRQVVRGRSRKVEPVTEKEWDRMLKMFEKVIALTKGDKRCRRKRIGRKRGVQR